MTSLYFKLLILEFNANSGDPNAQRLNSINPALNVNGISK